MSQRLGNEQLAELAHGMETDTRYAAFVGKDVIVAAILDLRDARAGIESLEKARETVQAVGEILGPWDWATWTDLIVLAQTRMNRIKELEGLSASQTEALEAIDRGVKL
jgi:hypothetical protein